jgi:hypothetical protein
MICAQCGHNEEKPEPRYWTAWKAARTEDMKERKKHLEIPVRFIKKTEPSDSKVDESCCTVSLSPMAILKSLEHLSIPVFPF